MRQVDLDVERRTDRETRPSTGALGRVVTRYDLVLAAVPVAIVLGALCAVLAGVDLGSGVVAGAALALCVVCYGVFGDPPTRREGGGDGGETAL